jgi:hypothetical protein
MGSLTEAIADRQRRRTIVDDCVILIDAEVADKRGLGGVAIKAAFKAVKRIRPGMVGMAMDGLLDDFAVQLDTYWVDCNATEEAPRAYFSRRGPDVANSLLGVTDARAAQNNNRVLTKAYRSLRPKAIDHICAAMPRFADLLVKHAS